VTEAQAHGDPGLPPLTQTLVELRDPSCRGWTVREADRLVACVRVNVSAGYRLVHLAKQR
jgi:hypothetical protein